MSAPPFLRGPAPAQYFHPLFKNFQTPPPLAEVIKIYSPLFKKKVASELFPSNNQCTQNIFSIRKRNYVQLNLVGTLKAWRDRGSVEVTQTSKEYLCLNIKNQKQGTFQVEHQSLIKCRCVYHIKNVLTDIRNPCEWILVI